MTSRPARAGRPGRHALAGRRDRRCECVCYPVARSGNARVTAAVRLDTWSLKAGAVKFPGRVEIRDLGHPAQVAGAVGVTDGVEVPVMLPERLFVGAAPSVASTNWGPCCPDLCQLLATTPS